MNRRDFLDPKYLAQSATGLLDAAGALPKFAEAQPSKRPEGKLLRYSRRAMATTFELILPYNTDNALSAAQDIFDEIDALEQQLTVYRDDSEVSRLNQRASKGPIGVERSLLDLLLLAQEIHQATEGAFDITSGALSKVWGFYRREGSIPDEDALTEALQRVGMDHVVLEDARQTVRFLKPGLEINLGSIGKGFALDCVGQLLQQRWKCSDVMLHGGQSSILALGNEPGTTNGWQVGIRHPYEPERRLAILRLRDRALGTSAITYQHLEHEGKKLGHILDPRNGWPAQGLAGATAVAPTAAVADALATAFFILGVEGTSRFCQTYTHIGAVLLPEEPGAAPVIFNLTPEEIQLSAGFGHSQQKQ